MSFEKNRRLWRKRVQAIVEHGQAGGDRGCDRVGRPNLASDFSVANIVEDAAEFFQRRHSGRSVKPAIQLAEIAHGADCFGQVCGNTAWKSQVQQAQN